MNRLLLLAFVSCISTGAFAETYIIPIWTSGGLTASDGIWYARAIAINASSAPVSYRVTGIYPLQSVPCPDCTGDRPIHVIEPGAAIPLRTAGLPGARMTAGAFAIETSAPLGIQLIAYRAGQPELRQHLDVARRWIAPGRHTISAVERAGATWRMNLFVTNPRETPVIVSAWFGERGENERRQTITPHATAVLAVPPCQCPFTTDYPPSPVRVEVETDGEVLTSVSSLSGAWAVFSLADAARE